MRFVLATLTVFLLVVIAAPTFGQRASNTSSARAAYSMPSIGSQPKQKRKIKKEKIRKKKKIKLKRQKRERQGTEAARFRRKSLSF